MRKVLIVTLLSAAIVALLAMTALAAESWATDPKTGAKVGWDSPFMTLTAASWSGPVADGKADGKGSLMITVSNKAGESLTGQFEAEMTAGKPNGKMRGKWSNGDTIDGSFVDGRAEGRMVYKWTTTRNGRVFDGEYRDSLPNGQGVYKEANGKVIYEGQWVDGVPASRPGIDKGALGVPWGATPDEVKKAMQARPNTSLRYSWKEGGNRTVHQYLGPFNDKEHWIFFWFLDGRMYSMAAHYSAPDAQIDRVMEMMEVTRKGMAERYGPADVETGKYMDARLAWYWPGKYQITLKIEKVTTGPEPGYGTWLRYSDSAALLKAEGQKTAAAKNDF